MLIHDDVIQSTLLYVMQCAQWDSAIDKRYALHRFHAALDILLQLGILSYEDYKFWMR